MKITVVLKNGETMENVSVREMFPTYNSEFSLTVDHIEIVDALFTIRVSTCFLLSTEAGTWYANVLTKNGTYRSWNGRIYGQRIYIDGNPATLTAESMAKYRAIISARDALIAEWKK